MLTITFGFGGVLYLFRFQDSFLVCPVGIPGMEPALYPDLGSVFAELLESFEDSEEMTVADLMDKVRDIEPLPHVQYMEAA
jgi:hypothetical protein